MTVDLSTVADLIGIFGFAHSIWTGVRVKKIKERYDARMLCETAIWRAQRELVIFDKLPLSAHKMDGTVVLRKAVVQLEAMVSLSDGKMKQLLSDVSGLIGKDSTGLNLRSGSMLVDARGKLEIIVELAKAKRQELAKL